MQLKGTHQGDCKTLTWILFVLKLGSEIPVALFPINEEVKVCFSLSFFAVLRAKGYFKDHLDQGNAKRIFCAVEYVLSVIQYGSQSFPATLAWKIPRMEELGRLQSMGSLRFGHDLATSLWLFTFMHWRRKWQPTPVFLPGESQGRGSLVGCRLWRHTESADRTEVT